MLKKEITFIERVRKKLACQIDNCGKNIVFTVSENDIKFLDKDKIKFTGKCTKCLRTVKIKSTDWQMFNKLMGQSKLEMSNSTYSAIFEEQNTKTSD
jgi:hypothetical protein